jgi:hypothetical protein
LAEGSFWKSYAACVARASEGAAKWRRQTNGPVDSCRAVGVSHPDHGRQEAVSPPPTPGRAMVFWLVGAAGVATTPATGLNIELRPLALAGTTRRVGGFPTRAGTRTQVTAAGGTCRRDIACVIAYRISHTDVTQHTAWLYYLASALIAKGADIKTVQARMGHMNNPKNANEGAGHRLLLHRHRVCVCVDLPAHAAGVGTRLLAPGC